MKLSELCYRVNELRAMKEVQGRDPEVVLFVSSESRHYNVEVVDFSVLQVDENDVVSRIETGRVKLCVVIKPSNKIGGLYG